MFRNPEITILLQILKGDASQETPAVCNTGSLIKLAERHKVVYATRLFAQQHPEFFTREQIAQLENHCRQAAIRSLTQLNELKQIAEALHSEGVKFVTIKGPQLSRKIYGRQALKESVDLDILLVNSDDLLRVHEILKRSGYAHSNLNDYRGWLSRRLFLIAKREVHYFNRETRCAIDLHIRPGANTYLTEKYFNGFLSDLRSEDLDGTMVPVLPDETYYVYLCYHGALHQFSRLAWLMDIRAFLELKKEALNYEKILSTAMKIRAERCVLLTLGLLQRYFGDDYVETHCHASLRSKRMKYLISSCMLMAGKDAGYGLTLRGRAGKVVYIMLLTKGISAKIDWLFGILMRQMIKSLAKPQSRKEKSMQM